MDCVDVVASSIMAVETFIFNNSFKNERNTRLQYFPMDEKNLTRHIQWAWTWPCGNHFVKCQYSRSRCIRPWFSHPKAIHDERMPISFACATGIQLHKYLSRSAYIQQL
jgi:hypothetical protein